jgi:dihydropyrimidinase
VLADADLIGLARIATILVVCELARTRMSDTRVRWADAIRLVTGTQKEMNPRECAHSSRIARRRRDDAIAARPLLVAATTEFVSAFNEVFREEQSMKIRVRSALIATLGGASLLALVLVVTVSAQQPAELLIRNGTIVNATGRTEGDVRIRNGTIAEIGRGLKPGAGAREIDATGKLILPGGVDPHVHIGLRPGIEGSDDYTTASRAALAGGVTTIGNFISQDEKEPLAETMRKAGEMVKKETIADILLHITVGNPKTVTPADLEMMAKQYTMKIFTSRPQFDTELTAFTKLIEDAGKAGVLTMMHCEDRTVNDVATGRLVAKGQTAIKYYPQAKPVTSEEVATQRCVAISDVTGAPIYIVHLSSERALRVVEAAQARGVQAFIETRILYVHLTQERFEGEDANIYTGTPPLREKRDKDALWKGMADGHIAVLATDHVGYTRADKMHPSVNIVNNRSAGNYLQVNMPLLYSEGVRTKKITLEQMVALTSTNPAKLFGAYPRKGAIAVGSDADLAIWDPNLKKTVTDAEQLANAKFSIFSGWEVTGWPIVTVRRGEVVWEGGQMTAAATAGSGQLVPRQRWQSPAAPMSTASR